MVVQPFDYRTAASFWGLTDPRLVVLLHSVVGGTPAYRRQFVRDDAPDDLADFDAWVVRAVLNPDRPLLREARYLLTEETDIRDPALYHSVLAAVATGNQRWGAIASYVGRKGPDISHPLNVLEDCGLLARQEDCFRSGRSTYRITEPLISFYEAIMRPRWADWSRAWARACGGTPRPGSCPESWARTLSSWAGTSPGSTGEVMGLRQLDRLRRALALLTVKGYQASETVLACYAGAGFDDALREEAGRHRLLLVGPNQLYGRQCDRAAVRLGKCRTAT